MYLGTDVLMVTLFVLVFGITLFVKGLLWFRLRMMVENMPTSKVRSLAMGLVEVCGEAVQAEKKVLKSPLTGNDCVYYSYKIEELRQEGKHSRWMTVRKGEDRVKFFLRDDTGSVLVDSEGAKIEIPADFQFQTGWGKTIPENVVSFMEHEGLAYKSFLGMGKSMRFAEHFIAPGDKLYIMGTAGDNPHVEEGTAKRGHEDIMIRKGNNEKLFYISDSCEKDLLKRLRWKSLGGIFGGIGLIAGCLAFIFFQLGVF